MPDPGLANSLLSGLLGGVVVAGMNYVLTRRRTLAEITKLELEAAKIRKELGDAVASIPAAVGYTVARSAEQLIYASKDRALGYDFVGSGQRLSRTVDGKSEDFGSPAAGSVTFDGDMINIHRTNTDGRYELWLTNYRFEGREIPAIPANESKEGDRRLRISCEAKVVAGQHTLRFVLKNEKTNKWLVHAERTITEPMWTPLHVYCQISAAEQCRLRIDDIDVSKAPSSIQIRDLVLAEKAAGSGAFSA